MDSDGATRRMGLPLTETVKTMGEESLVGKDTGLGLEHANCVY